MSSLNYLSIDFGTSNSLVGGVISGQKYEPFKIDPKNSDQTMMRTLLYFPNPDICFYGAEAISEYIANDMEGRLFRSFKSHLPNKNYLGTVLDNRILTLEKMIGTFLLELKKRAEKNIGQQIDKAIIGRPARYSMDDVEDGFALHRMQKAAEFAGFKEVHFVPEPLAAAFDYRKNIDSEKIVLIGDFGGGTSDFTLIRMAPQKFTKKDVLSIEGCPLAGDAFDSLFMSHRLNEYFGAKAKYKLPMSSNVLTMPKNVSLRLNHPAHIVHLKEKETYEFIKTVQKTSLTDKDSAAVSRLFTLLEDQQIFSFFEEIEKTKRSLSLNQEVEFNFNYPDLDIRDLFTRPQFEEWSQDNIQKIFTALDRCLASAQVKPEDVDLVTLTGGTSKVPIIEAEFAKRFGVKKLRSQSQFHSVLLGLTEAAGLISEGHEVL